MSDLRIDYSELTGLVDEGQAQHDRGEDRKGRVRALPMRLARWALALIVLATLPFVVLIRGGVFAYRAWAVGTWPALFIAALATALILWAYAWAVGLKLGAGRQVGRLMRRAAAGVGVAYVLYALVYVAGANVKSDHVRAEYRSLHPLLRMATSAVILADPVSVMTDASRTPEDYWLMGLPRQEASLHFEQDDGFVHALDLRTVGRSELRNRALELGLWALGFSTLRHVGTADHLHVSLRLPG